jgi:phage shock protein A
MAAAYGEMAEENKSVDEEIEKALGEASASDTDDELEQLKAELDSEK